MKRTLLTVMIVALAAPWGAAQRAPQQQGTADQMPPILRQALRKMASVRYSGTRNVAAFEGASREQHIEYVLRDGAKSRTWFPAGSPYAGQVIVETAQERRHYYPGKDEIHVRPAQREEAMARLMSLGRRSGIRIDVKDGASIAGRRTALVSIAEGAGNPMQRLWIDREHAVILKRELFDAVGTRVGYFEFTEIDFTPNLNEGDFELDRKGSKIVTPVDELLRLSREMKMTAARLPDGEGYRLNWARTLTGGRVPILQQMYSKPGVNVSLFQANADMTLPTARRAQRGMESLSWTRNGNTFALMGNVTAEELRRLARLLGYR